MANQPVPRHHVTKLLMNKASSPDSAEGRTTWSNVMASLVFDSPVTLVVKTPNQKVDDLRIDCALEWSVEQLKRHLSSVYPTKPESQHQRIIYSGQLLNDNLILKDVFREHEDGKHHTVHLVCPMKTETKSTTDSQATKGSSTPTTSGGAITTETASTTPVTPQTATDGLRYRGANTPTYPQYNMYHQQMANAAYNLPVQGQGYVVPPFVPPPYWMQQMFAQQMAAGRIPQPNMFMPPNYGYPQMPYPWLPQAGNFPAPQAPVVTPPPQHVPQTPPQQAAEQPQAPQPQGNENIQANANAGPLFDEEEDEENPNRDWLDKIYTLCRIGILLSIFWFYSSTSRFLVLIITFVLIYLYQSGILRIFRRNGGNNRQQIPPPAPAPEPQQQEQRQEQDDLNRPQEDVTDNAGHNTEDSEQNDTNDAAEPSAPPTPPPGPSATTVAYNFVTSFFTSLFPNGPGIQN